METYLDRIVEHHRHSAENDQRRLDDLIASCANLPPARGFRRRIIADARTGLAVISEIKRRSPSKGDLRIDLDPAELARTYQDAGASCLSVLTDETFFAGSREDLRRASEASSLPVLRKDFTVSAADVCDARIMGADCVLLIASVLSDSELKEFSSLADRIGIDVLVEIHDERELDRAMGIGATMVGVNQRDLVTFQVDRERALRMAPMIPDGIVKIAESGVRTSQDAWELAQAGYHAVLVGEALVTSGDPGAQVRSLRRGA